MKIYYEIETANEVRDMAWSGAIDTLNYLTDEEIETILSILEDCFYGCGEEVTETTINDFFWFEDETIAEWLGYNNFDEIMNRED